jgi:hypothetical protein
MDGSKMPTTRPGSVGLGEEVTVAGRRIVTDTGRRLRSRCPAGVLLAGAVDQKRKRIDFAPEAASWTAYRRSRDFSAIDAPRVILGRLIPHLTVTCGRPR